VEQGPAPTPRELEILKVLWELGPSTVRVVYQHSFKSRGFAYNTIQTLLRIMAAPEKNLVSAQLEGRAYVYTPLLSRDVYAARFLAHVFGGAIADMIQSLLRSQCISADELEQMHAIIGAARRRKAKSAREGAA
jgi:predicted transcriptional regulator